MNNEHDNISRRAKLDKAIAEAKRRLRDMQSSGHWDEAFERKWYEIQQNLEILTQERKALIQKQQSKAIKKKASVSHRDDKTALGVKSENLDKLKTLLRLDIAISEAQQSVDSHEAPTTDDKVRRMQQQRHALAKELAALPPHLKPVLESRFHRNQIVEIRLTKDSSVWYRARIESSDYLVGMSPSQSYQPVGIGVRTFRRKKGERRRRTLKVFNYVTRRPTDEYSQKRVNAIYAHHCRIFGKANLKYHNRCVYEYLNDDEMYIRPVR